MGPVRWKLITDRCQYMAYVRFQNQISGNIIQTPFLTFVFGKCALDFVSETG